MPTTGPNSRFHIKAVAQAAAFVLVAALSLPAAEDTVPAVLADLASALSEGNAPSAIGALDKSMKDFGSLSANIEGMLAQSEVLCSIEVVTESVAGNVHEIEADWYLQIKGRESGQVERRRERVRLKLEKIKGLWKITSLSPATVLEPPSPR